MSGFLDPAPTTSPPQPWRNGGGVTRELLAWPDARDWRVRVSVADIEADGPFSAFPGVQRWFAVLKGAGVALCIDGAAQRLTRSDAPFAFDGAAQPTCRLLDGPTRDLNLMLRGAGGSMRVAEDGQDWQPHPSIAMRTVHRGGRTLPGRRLRHRSAAVRPAVVRARTRTARIRGRPATGRRSRLVAHGHARGAGGMTTLWRNARLATLAGDAAGAWSSAARCWSMATRIALGRAGGDRCRATLRASTPSTTSAARSSRRASSTATRTSSTAASARASSSCACRAPATKRSRAPAAASARPSRPRARPATKTLLRAGRASALQALMAEGVTTIEIKSGYGLALEHEARCLRVARRLGARAAASRCARPTSPRTRCRPNSTAAPTTTSTRSAHGCRRCTPKAWSMRSTRSATRIGFTPAQTRRVFDAAAALRPAGQAARRAAQRPGRRGAGRASTARCRATTSNT